MTSLALLLLLTALGPAAALALTSAVGPSAGVFELPGSAGCVAIPAHGSTEAPDIVLRRYDCAGTGVTGLGVTLRAETFPARAAARPILDEALRMTRAPDTEDQTTQITRIHGVPWTVTRADMPPHLAASLLWEDGRPATPGLSFRLRRAWDSIVGGASPVVLVVLTPDPEIADQGAEGLHRARLALETFLDSTPRLTSALNAVAPPR